MNYLDTIVETINAIDTIEKATAWITANEFQWHKDLEYGNGVVDHPTGFTVVGIDLHNNTIRFNGWGEPDELTEDAAYFLREAVTA